MGNYENELKAQYADLLDKKDLPQCYVKILVYKDQHPFRVVYYRNKISIDQCVRWRWYFEYLTARIKVKHPRMRVQLMTGWQTLLQGEEYVQKKIKDLLRAKKCKVKKLQTTPVVQDLFGFGLQDQLDKITNELTEIAKLENGEYTGYVPPTYINEIKEWI